MHTPIRIEEEPRRSLRRHRRSGGGGGGPRPGGRRPALAELAPRFLVPREEPPHDLAELRLLHRRRARLVTPLGSHVTVAACSRGTGANRSVRRRRLIP